MIYIIISIIGLLVIVALFTYSSKSKTKTEEPPVVAPPADCCGAHAICEKGLKKIDEKIEYFDDEELDQYRGIPSDSFNDQQIDQFREILYTIRPEELSDWFISLEKRGIELPDVLKQELNSCRINLFLPDGIFPLLFYNADNDVHHNILVLPVTKLGIVKQNSPVPRNGSTHPKYDYVPPSTLPAIVTPYHNIVLPPVLSRK